MNRFATISIAVGLGAFANAVIATDYPTKPVRIIVPFAAGAAADAVTRVVAKKLTEYWGKQVILDNRPGVPGIQVAANATPDGYTRARAWSPHRSSCRRTSATTRTRISRRSAVSSRSRRS